MTTAKHLHFESCLSFCNLYVGCVMYRTYGTASTSHLWGDSIEVVTKYMLFMYYYVAVTNLSSRRICFVVLTEVFMEDFC